MNPTRLAQRLPFFYGWVIVGVAFVTMAIGVNARTAFSLFFPPIVDEFGWDRGLAAGAFSFGFLISAIMSPIVGRVVDRHGPLAPIEIGATMVGLGLIGAVLIQHPWQLYLTLGVMVGAGVNCMGYTVQSLYLPHWFVRNRATAIGIAFAGAGLGSIILLPLLQVHIGAHGWREACLVYGIFTLVVLVPLNLLVKGRPRDLGLEPDGAVAGDARNAAIAGDTVVDHVWAGTEWTLRRALRTARFWWLAIGFFGALWGWYAVQVHQTKYLLEIGFSPMQSAWALGLVSVVGIPFQIAMGYLSDRIGREPIWVASSAGFVLCYLILVLMQQQPLELLLYLMILAQGFSYGMTSVMGPMVMEIFQGRHYGTIFGILNLASIGGGAAGPWVTGKLYDLTGSYTSSWWVALALCALSGLAIWLASPRKVRTVPGRLRRAA